MAELTERETKIAHIFLTVLNSQYSDVPQNVKEGLLAATLKVRGIKYDEPELADLVNALNQEQTMIARNALGYLAKHGGAMQALKHIRLDSKNFLFK